MRRIDILIILGLLFFPFAAEGADTQETLSKGPSSVMVVTFQDDSEIDHTLGEIIRTAASLELQRSGISVAAVSDSVTKPVAITTSYEHARGEHAGFLLITEYSLQNERISLSFSFHDVVEETLLTETTERGTVDLTLDTVISEAVNKMIASDHVQEKLATRKPSIGESTRSTPSANSSTPEGSQSQTSGKPTGPRSGSSTDHSEAAGDTRSSGAPVASQPSPSEVKTAGSRSIRKPKPVEIAVGFAPFLSTGKLSAYSEIGYVPSLSINYRFDLGPVLIGLGIFSGFNFFNATSLVTHSENYLIPIGADIRLLSSGISPLSLYIRVCGGASILVIKRATGDEFNSVLPFVTGGMGVSWALSSHFGISLDVGYITVFDASFPIMGFTPSLYFFIRF